MVGVTLRVPEQGQTMGMISMTKKMMNMMITLTVTMMILMLVDQTHSTLAKQTTGATHPSTPAFSPLRMMRI
jgi:hypothetical protein